MDVTKYNQQSWNTLVEREDVWTRPVNDAVIAAARAGRWSIVLTANKSNGQIQGQIEAGLVIAGLYEDKAGDRPLDRYIDCYVATRAVKLDQP